MKKLYILISIMFICLFIFIANMLVDIIVKKDTFTISENILSTEEGVDIDLTNLNSTILFVEIYNMLNNYEYYSGKNIKLKGTLSEYKDLINQDTVMAITIEDAGACCIQNFEIELDESYLDILPNLGDEITVLGRLEIAQEVNGYVMYYKLKEAVFL